MADAYTRISLPSDSTYTTVGNPNFSKYGSAVYGTSVYGGDAYAYSSVSLPVDSTYTKIANPTT